MEREKQEEPQSLERNRKVRGRREREIIKWHRERAQPRERTGGGRKETGQGKNRGSSSHSFPLKDWAREGKSQK